MLKKANDSPCEEDTFTFHFANARPSTQRMQRHVTRAMCEYLADRLGGLTMQELFEATLHCAFDLMPHRGYLERKPNELDDGDGGIRSVEGLPLDCLMSEVSWLEWHLKHPGETIFDSIRERHRNNPSN